MNDPINKKTMCCAVFASGNGSNFQALLDQKAAGNLHVDFKLLISNNSGSGVFERGKKNSIPTVHLSQAQFETQSAYTKKLLLVLDENNIDLIILAGYMKKLPPELVSKYRYKIVNIHPGLLPSFGGKGMYGSNVHRAVIEYGVKLTGITVHFVDEEYDEGPIILQEAIPVLDSDDADSLAKRVLAVEHKHFWRAIEAIAAKRLSVKGRKVYGNV